MSNGRTALLIGALATLGAAGAAHAADAPKLKPSANNGAFTARDEFAPSLNQWGVQTQRKSLQFDAKKGKWGLKLDMEQTAIRDLGWRDVGAGAYYKVTPSLRVGGGVSVNTNENDELRAVAPRDKAPKVKLETSFKF